MHLLGLFGSDVVRNGHLRYQLRWPNSMLGMVDSADWRPDWLDDQDSTPGRFTWPLGRNMLYADLLIHPDTVVGTAARHTHFGPLTEWVRVPCAPAFLDIAIQ